MTDRSKAEVVFRLFGVNLEQQGRGFYVSLEMLAIARGVYLAHQEDAEKFAGLLDNGADTVAYKRTSHDLARRIATDSNIVEGNEELGKAVELDSPETMETLHALFSSLLVEIPGRRSQPSWFGAHIYPFVGELIHYDAVDRRIKRSDAFSKSAKKLKQASKVDAGINAPSIERYLFRDGGGWAYKVLRSDPVPDRKETIRQGLGDLVQDSGTPLGNLAKALSAHDFDYDEAPYIDDSEARIELYEDLSPWPDLLREGARNIVARTTTVPRAKRTESLMHWVPYCLARHQLHLARRKLDGTDRESILLDFGNEATPLRRESQKNLIGFRNDIVNAINAQAREMIDKAEGDGARKRRYERFTKETGNAVASPRAFFSETLAAVGALNATVGRRHFTMKPPMLEALVSATVAQSTEMEFDQFCALLYEKYRLVVENKVAAKDPLAYEVDPSVLAHNGKAFREKLAAIGLLTQYSDATSMVRGEPR
ncbi:hypothetical protein AB0D71_02055 [Streptomyces avermitilis]|uniref:hypothetical protein n=1 Tax=Streptomyces avermitilis TaxID=33903 RepID=UPI003401199C